MSRRNRRTHTHWGYTMSMRRMRYAAAVAALFAVALWTTSCSTSPTQPEHRTVSLLERPQTGKPAQTLTTTADITPGQGGTLELGNSEIGTSTLTVPPHAVDAAVTLSMSLTTSGTVMVEFGPAMSFYVPLELSLSFKGAELGGIDPSDIQLYYLDPVLGPTLVIPSGVPGEDLVVEAELTHFSQYSPGSEE